MATSYVKSPIAGGQLSLFEIKGVNGKEPMKIEISKVSDVNSDGAVDLIDIEWLLKHDANVAKPLKENGDFRSPECIELLKEADIVVTNPPFSLFREYLAQLVEHGKKFLIIGNTNALTYKEIFKLIKDNKIRTGYTNFNVGMFFVVPNDWEHFHHIDKDGKKIARVSSSCWFTNFDVAKHNQDITLYKKYTAKEYPKYDNYNAINVDKYTEIPCDYAGYIGVPVTFVDKYNPKQFEIMKFRKGDDDKDLSINGKYTFFRIIIKNKKVKK
jgi:hypothetical protein